MGLAWSLGRTSETLPSEQKSHLSAIFSSPKGGSKLALPPSHLLLRSLIDTQAVITLWEHLAGEEGSSAD